MLENGVLKAGPPNNGNYEFEAIFLDLIHNIFRQDGCDIAFNSNGISETHCNISVVEDVSPLITISI